MTVVSSVLGAGESCWTLVITNVRWRGVAPAFEVGEEGMLMVTGQLTNMPTRRLATRGLDDSWTGHFAD